MNVYLLEADSDNYQTIFPVKEETFDLVEKIDGRSLISTWQPIQVKILHENNELIRLHAGDFPSMTTSAFPVFSRKAVESLKDTLTSNGELLPILCQQTVYYLFNITTFVNALNLSKCEVVRFPSGRIMTINRYEFINSEINDLSIFKVPQLNLTPFVTDRFVLEVNEHNLEGFSFKRIWSSS